MYLKFGFAGTGEAVVVDAASKVPEDFLLWGKWRRVQEAVWKAGRRTGPVLQVTEARLKHIAPLVTGQER